MRPIKLSEQEKAAIVKALSEKLLEQLDHYTFEKSTKITFTQDIGAKAKEKARIIYSPLAWLRMKKLVDHFKTEVSWFGLVKRLGDKAWYVYDVLVCRQQVNGAKVDTEDEDMLEFLAGLSDEQAEDLHFQAHSHVDMATTPSGTDMQNQQDILNNMPGQEGFYIFQIWNKRGDINSFIYDLDNNVFFDRDDVELEVDDPEFGSLDNYANEIAKLVSNITYFDRTKKSSKKKEEPSYLPGQYGRYWYDPTRGYVPYGSYCNYYEDYYDEYEKEENDEFLTGVSEEKEDEFSKKL